MDVNERLLLLANPGSKEHVFYLRVSSKAQGESGLGLERQWSSLAMFATSRKLNVVQAYVEVDSGYKGKQAELTKALRYCVDNNAVLVVDQVDRLGRRSHLTHIIKHDLGSNLITVDNPNDSSLVFSIYASMAQDESARKSYRVKGALAEIVNDDGTKGWRGTPKNLTNEGRMMGGEQTKAKYALLKRGARGFADKCIALGMSYRTTIKELNDSGFKTASGLDYSHPEQVKRLLTGRSS